MIKFNKYHVTNGTTKAKVWYSLDNRVDGQKCVTLYAREYCNSLYQIIPTDYVNNSDITTDYFEKGRVTLFSDHPLYEAARARAEQVEKERTEKYRARMGWIYPEVAA